MSFRVIWRIENIQSWLQERDDALYSPQFLAETLMNTRWKLRLSPNWQLEEKYISLTLQRDLDDHPELMHITYEISLLANDGSPFKSKTFMKKFAPKTIGYELNMKEGVILKQKNETYLPEGVLTVCCKLWKWALVSKAGQCSMRSVIGNKHLKSIEKIQNFNFQPFMPISFLLPSTDIRRISLTLFVTEKEFVFRRKHAECKNISWYSLKLYAVDKWERRTQFDDATDLSETATTKSADVLENMSSSAFYNRYFQNNILTLHLSVLYHPGIVSESVSSELSSADLQNLNMLNSERIHTSALDSLHSSDSVDDEVDQSSDECRKFDSLGNSILTSSTLKKDLMSLYETHLFCDIKLQTDTEVFPVHKSVLSARSPVFYKMFTTDMKEKVSECINVPDAYKHPLHELGTQGTYNASDWTNECYVSSHFHFGVIAKY